MNKNKTAIIAKREFSAIVKTRTFIIITVLGPFLIFALTALPNIINSNTEQIQKGSAIGIVGAQKEIISMLRSVFEQKGVILIEGEDEDSMKRMLLDESAMQGYVVIDGDLTKIDSYSYYSKTGTDFAYSEMINAVLGDWAIKWRIEEAGIELERVENLTRRPSLEVKKLTKTGEESNQDLYTIIITSIAFIMLLYMSVLLYGQMIGRAIVVEKSSKIVEILLSSARPKQIMFGKIIGVGAAGLVQYGVWIISALFIILVLSPILSFTLPAAINPTMLFLLVLFFLVAFLMYGAAYAALGAAAENEQNLGQLSWPLIVFLVIPMVMASTIIMNPDSAFTYILSYFPLTSPMVMFMRVLVNMPPLWEMILCFTILLLSIWAIVILAAKIFRTGILMTGKPVTFREIIRWLKRS
ncbi:MAG: ABC transporter permease [Sphaerochaetaceae bacterium]|nr:ABC transporter permease [Sphaerochaetaceae bacterium]